MLWTSDAWLRSHLSQQTSEPAYYIVDCRISNELALTDIGWIVDSNKLKMIKMNSILTVEHGDLG